MTTFGQKPTFEHMKTFIADAEQEGTFVLPLQVEGIANGTGPVVPRSAGCGQKRTFGWL